MASMRNWLHGKKDRVVVVHCKAGKGRSGTASCSYLISEEGWEVKKALNRFTERRMRPNMGKGVSIPSQLRWIGYVDRWAKNGKLYVERQVEVLEVHCWGLRDGVKIQIEGFVEDGKLIKSFHTFTKEEREVVRGEVKNTGMAQAVQEVMNKNGFGSATKKEAKVAQAKAENASEEAQAKSKGQNTSSRNTSGKTSQESLRTGTGDVVYRPAKRVVLPTNDINIDVERRSKTAFELTMITAVAHVWFNTYFEGSGPEQGGKADESGMFEIEWEAMDGIKGSSRKGTQAFERIAIVWRALTAEEGGSGTLITEPREDEEVKQSGAADWRGTSGVEPSEGKDLGMRTSSPTVSTSNSNDLRGERKTDELLADSADNDMERVRSYGQNGEEHVGGPDNLEKQAMTGESTKSSGTALTSDTHSSADGVVQGVKYHVSGAAHTSDLPDGRPESELQNAEEHILGAVVHADQRSR